jgi:hypothetical protein
MPRQPMYVELDDKLPPHIIGDHEVTLCGLVVPQALTWTTEEPEKVCPKCRKAEDGDKA